MLCKWGWGFSEGPCAPRSTPIVEPLGVPTIGDGVSDSRPCVSCQSCRTKRGRGLSRWRIRNHKQLNASHAGQEGGGCRPNPVAEDTNGRRQCRVWKASNKTGMMGRGSLREVEVGGGQRRGRWRWRSRVGGDGGRGKLEARANIVALRKGHLERPNLQSGEA
jgi:hypothetical protein